MDIQLPAAGPSSTAPRTRGWRAAGSHAIGLPGRESTPQEPFELIDWGVHHWDESGLGADAQPEPGLPPPQVVDMHDKEVEIVRHWLKEFEDQQQQRQRQPQRDAQQRGEM